MVSRSSLDLMDPSADLPESNELEQVSLRLIDYFVFVGYDGIPEHASDKWSEPDHNNRTRGAPVGGGGGIPFTPDLEQRPLNIGDTNSNEGYKYSSTTNALPDKFGHGFRTPNSFNCDYQANNNTLLNATSNTYHHKSICPRLIRRYPATDYPDFALPPDVVYFAQPEGCFVSYQYYHDYPKRRARTRDMNNKNKNMDRKFKRNENATAAPNYEFSAMHSETSDETPSSDDSTAEFEERGRANVDHLNDTSGVGSGRDCTSFIFTLTDKDSGKTRYGVCLNYFSPIADNIVQTGQTELTQPRPRDVATDLFKKLIPSSQTAAVVSKESDNYNEQEYLSEDTVPYSSKAKIPVYLTSLCLLSHYPFFTRFRELLACLKKLIDSAETFCEQNFNRPNFNAGDMFWKILTRDTCSTHFVEPMMLQIANSIENWIERLLQAPVPIPGKTKIELTILPDSFLPQTLQFALPDTSRFSLIDFPLHLPLELLGIDTCLRVITCILLEQKVLIQSRDHNALTMSVLALVAMIYPLEYMFPVIPLLPLTLKGSEQLLLAPTPYFIGIPSTFLSAKRVSLPRDVWLVDLDTNQLISPSDINLPALPDPEGTILRNHIQLALHNMTSVTPQATDYNFPQSPNLPPLAIERGKRDSFSLPVTPLGKITSEAHMYPTPLESSYNLASNEQISYGNGRTLEQSGNNLVDLLTPQQTIKMGLAPPYFHHSCDVDIVDMNTRIAMVKFFDSPNVFAHFEDHCHILRLYPRPVIAFQIDSFLKSRPHPTRFVYELAKTQAFEFFSEWSLSPNNAAFQRINIGISDPRLIGDKPKWYASSLTPVYFNALLLSSNQNFIATRDSKIRDFSQRKDSLAQTPDHIFYVILKNAFSNLIDSKDGKHLQITNDIDGQQITSEKCVDILKGVLAVPYHHHVNNLSINHHYTNKATSQLHIPINDKIDMRFNLTADTRDTSKGYLSSSSSNSSDSLGLPTLKCKKPQLKHKKRRDSRYADRGLPSNTASRKLPAAYKNLDGISFPYTQSPKDSTTSSLYGGDLENVNQRSSSIDRLLKQDYSSSTPLPESSPLSHDDNVGKVIPRETQFVPGQDYSSHLKAPLYTQSSQFTYNSDTGIINPLISPEPREYLGEGSAALLSNTRKEPGIHKLNALDSCIKGDTYTSSMSLPTMSPYGSSDPLSTNKYPQDFREFGSTLADGRIRKKKKKYSLTILDNRSGNLRDDIVREHDGTNSKHSQETLKLEVKHRQTSKRPEKLSEILDPRFVDGNRTARTDKITKHLATTINTITNPKKLLDIYSKTFWFKTRQEVGLDEITDYPPIQNFQSDILDIKRKKSSLMNHQWNGERNENITMNRMDHEKVADDNKYGHRTNKHSKVTVSSFKSKKRQPTLSSYKDKCASEPDHATQDVGGKKKSNRDFGSSINLNEGREYLANTVPDRRRRHHYTSGDNLRMSDTESSVTTNLATRTNIGFTTESNSEISARMFLNEIVDNIGKGQGVGWLKIPKLKTLLKHESCRLYLINKLNPNTNVARNNMYANSSLSNTEPGTSTSNSSGTNLNMVEDNSTRNLCHDLANVKISCAAAAAPVKIQQPPEYDYMRKSLIKLDESIPKTDVRYEEFEAIYQTPKTNFIPDVCLNKSVWKGYQSVIRCCLSGLEHTYANYGIGGMASSYILLEICATHYFYQPLSYSSTSSTPHPFNLTNLDADISRTPSPTGASDLKRKPSLLERQFTFDDIKSTCNTIIDPEKTYKKLTNIGKRVSTTLTQAASNMFDKGSTYHNENEVEQPNESLDKANQESPNNLFRDHIPTFDEYLSQKRVQEGVAGIDEINSEPSSLNTNLTPQVREDTKTNLTKSPGPIKNSITRQDTVMREKMLPSQHSIMDQFYTKHYLFTSFLGKNRSRIWDENQFWQDIFLDAVTQERDMIGMDIGPSEMIKRFAHLTDVEKKRSELEEDHLLSIQLLNLVSHMVMMQANEREICRKVRRLLAKAHMGLQYSQIINNLLDHINKYNGNQIPLLIPLSRRIRKMSFTVKSGIDPTAGTMIMEVCEDAIVFRTTKGDIIDRLWYDKLINMTLSPRAKVLCLWWKSGTRTYLQRFYTKKCRELYEAVRDIMEKIAQQQQKKIYGSEIGGHFEIGSLYSRDKGTLDICLDGITITFPDGKTTLHLDQIKRIRSEKNNRIFILQIFDYYTQQLVDLMYTAQQDEYPFGMVLVYCVTCCYLYRAWLMLRQELRAELKAIASVGSRTGERGKKKER